MKVSEKQRFALSQSRIGKVRTRQLEIGEKLASGLRVNRPSDDPVAARKAVGIKSEQSRLEQYTRNLDAANHLTATTDNVLSESSNLLYRAKELGIQAIHGGLTPDDREYLGNEIASIHEQLRTLANTRTNNRFIFGGFAKDAPPYDPALGFVGDNNVARLEVGDGLRLPATSPGGAAFGDGTAATVDVFDNLAQLEATVRFGFDPVLGDGPMQNQLARLEESIEQVIGVRNSVGVNMNRLDGAETVITMMQERLAATLSELQDVDFPATVTELQLTENALQGTMAVTSRLMKGTSLMDFL